MRKKKLFVIHILITLRDGDRKIMLPFRITSGSPKRIKQWKQFNQFISTSTKVTLMKKNIYTSYISTMNQGSVEAGRVGSKIPHSFSPAYLTSLSSN